MTRARALALRATPCVCLVLLGCSGDDGPACPGISSPTILELSDVAPAPGTSVVNEAIVHAFTVTSPIAFEDIALRLLDAHTAGAASAEPKFMFASTTDGTRYTADAISWETAPAHVEIEAPIVYETSEGCGYALPSPLFSYDIIAP
jgi:hypothetical protein